MTVDQKKVYWCVIGCGIVFLLLTLITLYFEPTISRDGTLYLRMAGVWQKNGSFYAVWNTFPDFRIPPFYLWLIRRGIDIGFPPEIAGRSISLICGITMPLLAYLIAQEVQKDQRVSLAAAFLMAVNPTVINYSVAIQRDMLYFALCGWTIYFCLRGILHNKIRSWIPAGILFGCSLLTRYETLELLPLLLLAFVLFGMNKKISWKRFLSQSASMAVSCLITVFALIYIIGVQNHILNYYQKFFYGKYDWIQSLYKGSDTGENGTE